MHLIDTSQDGLEVIHLTPNISGFRRTIAANTNDIGICLL